MKRIRLIPRIDIKGPNLVKGIHLEGLRVLGDPGQFARYYYEQGADELIFMDVVASLYERNSLHDIIRNAAKDVFIPITVGGGVRTIHDIESLLKSGADKVSINTAAIRSPELITEAAKEFGSSTIVVTIEAIKSDKGYFCFIDNGRQATGKDVPTWAKEVEGFGAGEILITSVDREGTGKGFDLELTQAVLAQVSIPVIAHGGAGRLDDIRCLARETDVSGIAVASVCHYHALQHLSQGSVPTAEKEGNTDFLRKHRAFGPITASSLPEIKADLASAGILTRMN